MNTIQKVLAFPLAVAACGYLALCLYLFLAQRSYLYFPTPRMHMVPAMQLARDGADLVVSMRPAGGTHAIVYLGGNAEDVSQAVPQLADVFESAAIYALHYRGYGGSSGKPTERDNVGDALALFDAISRKHAQVTLVGRSLGSGVAIQLASRRRVQRLVLVTPYASVAELAARHFRYVPVNWLLQDRYDSWKHAPAIDAPTTIIAAERDDVIPLASTRRLLGHFKPGIARLHVIAGADHNDVLLHPEYLRLLHDIGRAGVTIPTL